MTATITAKNIRSGKEVKIPAAGRIVSITYDCTTNYAHSVAQAEWDTKTVIGIVMSHSQGWDSLLQGKKVPSIKVLGIDGTRCEILFSRIVKATSTRSIPKKGRDALTSIYKWESCEKAKWDEKLRKLQEQRDAARAAAGADDIAATLAKSMDALTTSQFAAAVREKLSKEIARFDSDNWTVSCSFNNRVEIHRSVSIEKYYSGPMSYLEYDDCRTLFPDAIETEEGQRIVKRNRRELPLKAKINEWLELGDKNWLTYEARYVLGTVDGQLLTNELANEVVAKAMKKSSK